MKLISSLLACALASTLLSACSSNARQSNRSEGIAAGHAKSELVAGNQRFLAGGMDSHAWQQERVVKTGTYGQSPSVGVLSCADSRVPLELIFDQGVGDLFVVRNAGNFADDGGIGTLEFGVKGLGVHTIMVLGHTKCGAVNAAVTGAELPGDMPVFTAAIRPAVQGFARPAGSPDAPIDLVAAEEANARWQLQQLLARSEIIRNAVADGSVATLVAIYEVETGRVRFLD